MPAFKKGSLRVYLPGMVVLTCWMGIVSFARNSGDSVKHGHDFLPIYGEDGRLEGFTHPVLVEAGQNVRDGREVASIKVPRSD